MNPGYAQDYHARYALKINVNSVVNDDSTSSFVIWEEPNGKYEFMSNVRVYELDDQGSKELYHVVVPVTTRNFEAHLHGRKLMLIDATRVMMYNIDKPEDDEPFNVLQLQDRNLGCAVSFACATNEVRSFIFPLLRLEVVVDGDYRFRYVTWNILLG